MTVCYAAGDNGTIVATHDAGATWQRQTSGTHVPVLTITCPAVDVCFAPAGVRCDTTGQLLSTTDGGSTWSSKPLPLACPGAAFACPSVTTCYYVRHWPISASGEVLRTTDGGSTWRKRGRISPDFDAQGLACPTTTLCYSGGVDAIGRSTDGGKRWAISHIVVAPCPNEVACHQFYAITCPSQRICYAAGSYFQGTSYTGVAITTKDGFLTWRRHLIPGLHGMGGIFALSCPTPSICVGLGEGRYLTSRFATTADGGDTWRVGRTRPYLFYALACPSATTCFAAGFLGRLMRSDNGGWAWRDLLPAIFVSGTYGARQALHTYSRWFTATQPWRVTVGVVAGEATQGPFGIPAACPYSDAATANVTIDVRNAEDQIVAGPIRVPLHSGIVGRSTVQVTGRLRLDVVSHCSTFSVRVDGVE